jgi:hypothetical protein
MHFVTEINTRENVFVLMARYSFILEQNKYINIYTTKSVFVPLTQVKNMPADP